MPMTDKIHQFLRRTSWFTDRLTMSKFRNGLSAGLSYLFKRPQSSEFPLALKIDISPVCNLKCPVCIHAAPDGDELLEKQDFAVYRMSVDQFRSIVDQVRGKVSALSLYYLGDPYAHPKVDEMCGIARDANLNVHLSTNFSFRFTDERIRRIVDSGVSHLTVCVDGFSQETYSRTRINGRLDFVLSNLERVCQRRKELNRQFPRVEVQYIKFPHNVHELETALAYFRKIGVDQIEHSWGMVNNYADLEPRNYAIDRPRQPATLPLCHWPYDSMVIKYNGDVIPCCNFRHATQYVAGEDARTFGNVFSSSVQAIWNSDVYATTRRLVVDPKLFDQDKGLESHFCHGCPAVFQTSQEKNIQMAPEFDVSRRRVIPILDHSQLG
jgi:MoaA/NifB/PqqE/SkfB family radical SAM enzyme